MTSAADRAARARAVRLEVPRSSHAEWSVPAGRPDPVELVTGQEQGRLPWLVPVRRARMAASPFAFFRGSAGLMAADLAGTPTMGESVQLCGDAHVANFGTYRIPEGRRVFDVNDFDETLPGPWEWDVKRLAVSFVLVGRENRHGEERIRQAARHAVTAYQRAMASFAQASTMDVWFARIPLVLLRTAIPDRGPDRPPPADGPTRVLRKLTEVVGGRLRFRHDPPLLVPLRELSQPRAELQRAVHENFEAYLGSLVADRRLLLGRFQAVDVAVKAVGVGSVGRRCLLMLLLGRDRHEPLFLQIKEAIAPVLAGYRPTGPIDHQGRRVVEGQRLMQAAPDVFLGWSRSDGPDFYWRHLRDTRGTPDVSTMAANQLNRYAELCGWTLARSHARGGDAVAISAYLGTRITFADAVSTFAVGYAGQVVRDHAQFVEAVGIEAVGPGQQ